MTNSGHQMKTVLVLTTGGTIEKSYCEQIGSIENRESLLKTKLLSRLRLPYTDIQVEELMAKDSLNMTEEDRKLIFERIRELWPQKKPIVVLHGTDTLENTIHYCYNQSPNPPVAIVFTGAMKPAGFDDSDAQQNFTEALFASQILTPGFYLCFHGHLFEAPKIKKDHERGTFQ